MITEGEWGRMQTALRLAQGAAEECALKAVEAKDTRLRAQFVADAREYERLLEKMEQVPSWFEVWAALDVVADVVEGHNLDEGGCLECDFDVDDDGVCMALACHLGDGLGLYRKSVG